MRFIVLSLFWCSDHSGIDLNQPIKHICIAQSCCKSLPEPMEFPHLGRNCSHQSCNKLGKGNNKYTCLISFVIRMTFIVIPLF